MSSNPNSIQSHNVNLLFSAAPLLAGNLSVQFCGCHPKSWQEFGLLFFTSEIYDTQDKTRPTVRTLNLNLGLWVNTQNTPRVKITRSRSVTFWTSLLGDRPIISRSPQVTHAFLRQTQTSFSRPARKCTDAIICNFS